MPPKKGKKGKSGGSKKAEKVKKEGEEEEEQKVLVLVLTGDRRTRVIFQPSAGSTSE